MTEVDFTISKTTNPKLAIHVFKGWTYKKHIVCCFSTKESQMVALEATYSQEGQGACRLCSFPWLLEQIDTNWVTPSSRNLLPHSSGGQMSDIRCQQDSPFEGSRGQCILCLFQLQKAVDIPWLVVASLLFDPCGHTASCFPVCWISLVCLLQETCHWV
jgi:hypothetical protein